MFLVEVRQSLGISRYARGSGSREWLGEYEQIVVRLRAACDRIAEPAGKGIEFRVLEQVLHKATADLEGRRLASLDIFGKKTPSLEQLAQFIFKKAEILLGHLAARPLEVILELPQERQVIYRHSE